MVCAVKRIGTSQLARSRVLLACWLHLLLLMLLGPSSGCKSLGDGRRTKELSAARQRSLQGADELEQQNWGEAERLFAEALRRSPADERAQWGMAEILYQRGECEAAIEHMQAAAKLSGENPDLLVRLGQMHLQADRLDEAARYAEHALAGNRQCSAAWALQGNVLQRRKRLEEALSSYHRALIFQPNNPQVQLATADLYRELQRPQRALATLDSLMESRSDDPLMAHAWLLKGKALADLGERKESQDALVHAAKLAQDDDVDLLLQLAESQIESGELAEARLCLGRALQHDPQNPKALAIRGELAERFEQFNQQGGTQFIYAGFEQQQVPPK